MTDKKDQEKILKEYVEEEEGTSNTTNQVGPKLVDIPKAALPWDKPEMPIGNQLGWIPLKMDELPTMGLFYPEDTDLAIRSATGGEIRHWSTLQEEDLSALDDMLNYVIERCVTIKSKNPEGAYLSWKDIKEVDRFYILLAIHELTFPNGENKLQVTISDKKKIDVTKEMISYITMDPTLMKYYDETERCFVLKFKTSKKPLKLDIPSVGVTQWIKNYIIRRQRSGEFIDEDYLAFAPFIIRNWRGLTEDSYSNFVEDSHKWDIGTISLLVHVKKLFSDTIDPIVRFYDDGGTEQIAPLNFQGGIKSLFLISDPFGQLE